MDYCGCCLYKIHIQSGSIFHETVDEVKCVRHSFYCATEFALEIFLHFDNDKYVNLIFYILQCIQYLNKIYYNTVLFKGR